jgi:hypothetical protein
MLDPAAHVDSPPTDPGCDLDDTVFLGFVAMVMEDARKPGGPKAQSADSGLFADPNSGKHHERRLSRRLLVTRRVQLVFRKGTLGLGPNIGVSLADVGEDGLGVRLTAPVAKGEEASLELARPGVSKPLRLVAEVRWCRPAEDGTFLAGLRLRKRLPYLVLTDLTR